nr:hypothetical protein [Methylorubrum zatmanii]
MDDHTRVFAVETTAEISVLRAAIAVLLADMLRKLPKDEQHAILNEFVRTLSDVPPGAPFPTPNATQFFEAIAEALPHRAEKFAADVRQMLE